MLARNDRSHEEVVQGIVKEMNLDDPSLPVNQLGSDDFALAMHQEDTRSVVLWALLRPFLKLYVPQFTPENVQLSESELDKSIDVALNEPEFFLTQHLIKMHHKKELPLKLGKLAEQRYRRNSASWDRYKRKLAREVFDPMSDLLLWKIVTNGREDNNGGGAIASHDIWAGQALLDFDTYIYQPMRKKQYERFCERFLNK